jgi:hypothetical protein
MKNILLIIFLSISNFAIAQFGYNNSKDLDRLKKTTTVVVLDNMPTVYNERITYAFNNFWKFNKYIFVTENKTEPYLSDPQYSYFLRANRSSNSGTFPFRLVIGLNKKTKYASLQLLDHLVYVLYDLGKDGSEFCVINLVQTLQNYLINEDFYKDVQGLNEMKKHYESQSSIIKTKTLYIYNEYLNGDITEIQKINDCYNYNVEIVTKEKLEDAIFSQDDNVVYFYVTNSNDTYIITAKEGKIIYYNKYFTYKKGKINERDLKDLNKYLK